MCDFKKIIFIFAIAASSQLLGQEILTSKNFSSKDIIIIGTYQELLERQGLPSSSKKTYLDYMDIGHNDSANTNIRRVDVDRLEYDCGVVYNRIGDSVQIYMVDLRKSDIILHVDSIRLCRKSTLKELTNHFEIPRCDWKKMKGDDTFLFTSAKIKSFGIPTADGFCNQYFWFVFDSRNNHLIYICFPPLFKGGIVR